VVDAALARGHEVSIFTRGETNPGLFPEVEKLRGDRDGNLDALRGRTWDAAIDTSGQIPRVVRQSAELLHEHVPHYTFTSSVSAYASFEKGPSEDDPAHTEEPPDETNMEFYGQRKASCERVVQEVYGDRALIIRPGLIVGPHDPTGRFTYWPHRVARGGDVLAPEPRDAQVQIIDVRDLAEWMVRLAEEGASGVFNATGPAEHLTMEQLLEACQSTLNPDARLVWVDNGLLREHEVGEWMELPLWLIDPEMSGLLETDNSKAIAHGLTFRSLDEIINATLADAELTDAAGMKPERERELLEAWAASRGEAPPPEPSARRPA
jgi:2'-hydroxyisoflavone reductase